MKKKHTHVYTETWRNGGKISSKPSVQPVALFGEVVFSQKYGAGIWFWVTAIAAVETARTLSLTSLFWYLLRRGDGGGN